MYCVRFCKKGGGGFNDRTFITYRLDSVSNTHDEFSFLSHFVDEFHRNHAGVVGSTELLSSVIQGTAESVTLGKKWLKIIKG